MKHLSIYRHNRAARLHWEWHAHGGTLYLMAGVAHPRRHARWATTVYLYLPAWAARTPLARIPSSGPRSVG